jgi:parvulin-like peptidyl-prolyl isomerase
MGKRKFMFINQELPFEPLELVNFLKRELQLKQNYQKFLYEKIVACSAQEYHLTVTSEEIQDQIYLIRQQEGLNTISDVLNWLIDKMSSLQDWEAGIRNHLLAKKLAQHLFDHTVETVFNQRSPDFDRAVFYRIVVPYERTAQELCYQLNENGMSFYEAAHLYDISEQRRLQCGYEGKQYRCQLEPEIAELVFAGQLDEVIGPFKQSDVAYNLLLVEEITLAQLTPEVYEMILNQMFEEWLSNEFRLYISS